MRDLDTVDNGVKQHLPQLLHENHSLVVGHFLGVDHCGHRCAAIASPETTASCAVVLSPMVVCHERTSCKRDLRQEGKDRANPNPSFFLFPLFDKRLLSPFPAAITSCTSRRHQPISSYGPNHPAMTAKLREMDAALRSIVRELPDDALLVVMGDHGMTASGDHGGDSEGCARVDGQTG